MYNTIKKTTLAFMVFNIFMVQSVMGDILFYYTAAVLPSIISSNKTLDDFKDVVPHNPSFSTLHFSGSKNCAQCHDGISDTSTGEDVSIVKAWQG